MFNIHAVLSVIPVCLAYMLLHSLFSLSFFCRKMPIKEFYLGQILEEMNFTMDEVGIFVLLTIFHGGGNAVLSWLRKLGVCARSKHGKKMTPMNCAVAAFSPRTLMVSNYSRVIRCSLPATVHW